MAGICLTHRSLAIGSLESVRLRASRPIVGEAQALLPFSRIPDHRSVLSWAAVSSIRVATVHT
jgi:hypothetical protein